MLWRNRATGGAVDEEHVVVWERPERGARGPAAVHSRAELAAVAVTLADRDGLAALSMRRLATALGTGPASLYRYVAGREDLLDLMTDAVTGEIDLDAPLGGDPVADLTALALRTRAVHLRHPWLSDVPPEPLRLGPRGLDYLEYAIRAMADVELPGRAKTEAVALVNALVAQFARVEPRDGDGGDDRRAARAGYLVRAATAGNHPHLAAALADDADVSPRETTEELFERTMRRVIGGLLSDTR
ncbi:TetR/AcrR family transcriptional regulator [Streptomyces sedi]|uniref:TetR/AcrR family transcriptional regulator n=1 Tax=Streptomyces sedi TaxID=555059 RepID=A0A5C4UYB9_9ACTN|nr:TetR/AcrR family transcriptional regulator [Streptomyces sedi]